MEHLLRRRQIKRLLETETETEKPLASAKDRRQEGDWPRRASQRQTHTTTNCKNSY